MHNHEKSQENLHLAAANSAFGENNLPQPTPAQVLAGNYKKGRLTLYGLPIVIENPNNSYRQGVGVNGEATWRSRVDAHYGYISGTKGADDEEIDCFVGPFVMSDRVFILNQMVREKGELKFDEHKVCLGMLDEEMANRAYINSYAIDFNPQFTLLELSIEQFKSWLIEGDKTKPVTLENLTSKGSVMQAVKWNELGLPMVGNISETLYQIKADDGTDGLIFDSVSLQDIYADSDGTIALDAMVIPFARMTPKLNVMSAVMSRAGGDLTVIATQISEPFNKNGVVNVAVVFELSDGQSISVFFHNPDTTPKLVKPTDEMVSWKWLLNKKDITIVVAPERGRDLNLRDVARRIMNLAAKNSVSFVKKNVDKAERMASIESLKKRESELTATLAKLTAQADKLENDGVMLSALQNEDDAKAIADVLDLLGTTLTIPVGYSYQFDRKQQITWLMGQSGNSLSAFIRKVGADDQESQLYMEIRVFKQNPISQYSAMITADYGTRFAGQNETLLESKNRNLSENSLQLLRVEISKSCELAVQLYEAKVQENVREPLPHVPSIQNPLMINDYPKGFAVWLEEVFHELTQLGEGMTQFDAQGLFGPNGQVFADSWMNGFDPESAARIIFEGTSNVTDEPVANIENVHLTGNELDEYRIDGGSDFDAAKQYFDAKLKGKVVKTEAGDVHIVGSSWREMKREMKSDSLKPKLVPLVECILTAGIYEGAEENLKPSKPDVVAYHFFRKDGLQVGDLTVSAGVTVEQLKDGMLEYSLKAYGLGHSVQDRWKKKKGIINTSGQEPEIDNPLVQTLDNSNIDCSDNTEVLLDSIGTQNVVFVNNLTMKKANETLSALGLDQIALDSADLSHAISSLEIALEVVNTNYPINLSEGKFEQAELEKNAAESFTQALVVLNNCDTQQPILDSSNEEDDSDLNIEILSVHDMEGNELETTGSNVLSPPKENPIENTKSPLDTYEESGGQSWQVTQAQWVELMSGHFDFCNQEVNDSNKLRFKQAHEDNVKKALDDGENIPEVVLADYPKMIKETPEEKEARYAKTQKNLDRLLSVAAGELVVDDSNATKSLLNSVIDGSIGADRMSSPELGNELTAVYQEAQNDLELMKLLNEATNAYTNAMIASMQSVTATN